MNCTCKTDKGALYKSEAHSGSQQHTARIFIICILFVYLILAALYNSLLLPLAILLTIPCGLAGAFLLAQLLHLQNDIYFQLGAIMLIGLLAKTMRN
ncbi:MAG: efflux RND transporter permease subunit [Paludibacteraceae bacterium]